MKPDNGNNQKPDDGSDKKPPKNVSEWLPDTFETFLKERITIAQTGSALPGLLSPVFVPDNFVKDLFPSNEQSDFKNKAAESFFTSSSYCIGLIDTGVRDTHQDIRKGSIELRSYNHRLNEHFKEDVEDVKDQHGHGTHIAGILAGNGIKRGIAPGASIVSYKITDENQSSTTWVRVADALQQIIDRNRDASQKKISVVNLSYNAFNNLPNDIEENVFSERIKCKIEELYEQNVPLVVSGGNYFDAFVKWDKKFDALGKRDKKNDRASNPEKSYGLAFPANHTKVIACGASCLKGDFKAKSGLKKMVEEDLAPFTQRPNPQEYDPLSSAKTFILTTAVETNSLGIESDTSYSVLMGSSMAAPVIAGTIFLLQHLHLKSGDGSLSSLPAVMDVRNLLLEICGNPKKNIGGTEFLDSIKQSKAFFNNEDYKHLAEADAIKLLAQLLKSKSISKP